MAVTVTHATAADGTFSASGATAWDEAHTVAGELPIANGGTGAATAQAAAAALGVPYKLASWGVPVILASSGTMGNNGAVSAMTALPTTYDGGAWLYLPANAIQAGSAAGFYWFVASSTTAGTVYNSTFDGLSVPAAGTTTAFVSTGPGAFTGVAAGEIVAVTITIAANTVGANGRILYDIPLTNNTAAGNKIVRLKLGATTHVQQTLTTTAFLLLQGAIFNRGVTNAQMSRNFFVSGGGLSGSATYGGTTDMTASTTFVLSLEKATATNHVLIDGGHVLVVG